MTINQVIKALILKQDYASAEAVCTVLGLDWVYCQECNTPFPGLDPRQEYCSRSCASRVRMRRWMSRGEQPPEGDQSVSKER